MTGARRRRRAAALGAACAALAGCGFGGPDVPEGFATTEVERLQVSHPDDWTVSEQERGEATDGIVSYEVDGTELSRIDIRHEMAFASSHTHAVAVATQGRRGNLADYEEEVSEISGTGAEDARRVDFSFTGGVADGDGELTGEPGTVQGIDVVLLSSDYWAHHVLVSWADGELDPETAEAIVATVYLDD